MPTPTLGIRIEIDPRSFAESRTRESLSRLGDQLGEAIGPKFTKRFGLEVERGMKDIEKRVTSQLKFAFNPEVVAREARKVGDIIRREATLRMDVDRLSITRSVAVMQERMEHFQRSRQAMDRETSRVAVEMLRERFGEVQDQLDAMRRQAADAGRAMDEGVVAAVTGLAAGLAKVEDEGKAVAESAGRSERSYAAIEERARAIYDHAARTADKWWSMAKGAAAVYLSWQALKDSMFEVFRLQDQVMGYAVQGGVSMDALWGDIKSSATAAGMLKEDMIPVLGALATRGRDAFAAFHPYVNDLARMKRLGTDFAELGLEHEFNRAAAGGARATQALMSVSKAVFAIGETELRNKVLQNLVDRSQMMGVKGPEWMQRFAGSTIAVVGSLQKLGVSTGAIGDFMDKLSNISATGEDLMSRIVLQYGGNLGQVLAGNFEGALPAMQKFYDTYRSSFEEIARGGPATRQAYLQIQGAMGGTLDRNLFGVIQTLGQRGPAAVRSMMDEMKKKSAGPEQFEAMAAERASTMQSLINETSNIYHDIMEKLGKVLIPAFRDILVALGSWMSRMNTAEFAANIDKWAGRVESAAGMMIQAVEAVGGLGNALKIYAGVKIAGGAASVLTGHGLTYWGARGAWGGMKALGRGAASLFRGGGGAAGAAEGVAGAARTGAAVDELGLGVLKGTEMGGLGGGGGMLRGIAGKLGPLAAALSWGLGAIEGAGHAANYMNKGKITIGTIEGTLFDTIFGGAIRGVYSLFVDIPLRFAGWIEKKFFGSNVIEALFGNASESLNKRIEDTSKGIQMLTDEMVDFGMEKFEWLTDKMKRGIEITTTFFADAWNFITEGVPKWFEQKLEGHPVLKKMYDIGVAAAKVAAATAVGTPIGGAYQLAHELGVTDRGLGETARDAVRSATENVRLVTNQYNAERMERNVGNGWIEVNSRTGGQGHINLPLFQQYRRMGVSGSEARRIDSGQIRDFTAEIEATGVRTARESNFVGSFGRDLVAGFAELPEDIRKKLILQSPKRSRHRQQELYDQDVREHGGRPSGLVARPGTSRHEAGIAADVMGIASLNPEQQRVYLETMARHGIGPGEMFAGGDEFWHMDRISREGTAAHGGTAPQPRTVVAAPPTPPPPGPAATRAPAPPPITSPQGGGERIALGNAAMMQHMVSYLAIIAHNSVRQAGASEQMAGGLSRERVERIMASDVAFLGGTQ